MFSSNQSYSLTTKEFLPNPKRIQHKSSKLYLFIYLVIFHGFRGVNYCFPLLTEKLVWKILYLLPSRWRNLLVVYEKLQCIFLQSEFCLLSSWGYLATNFLAKNLVLWYLSRFRNSSSFHRTNSGIVTINAWCNLWDEM